MLKSQEKVPKRVSGMLFPEPGAAFPGLELLKKVFVFGLLKFFKASVARA